MDCPRCGEGMIHYEFGDSETWSCGGCQYSGVPVEHRSDRSSPESWDECLQRFYSDRGVTSDGAATVRETDDDEGLSSGADEVDRDPSQCAAATNSGDRCSRDARDGERYCWQHLGLLDRDGLDGVTDYAE